MSKTLLRMTGISKSFSSVRVLREVDFTVNRREIHALLGENGAGKSTLMNILTGVVTPDAGRVEFDGKVIAPPITIPKTEAAGIAFVHQELNLINDLKVYENIFLTRELTGPLGRLRKGEMRRQTAELFQRLGVQIDPDALVSGLKASQKQLVEIARALHRNAKLIILDEPTTALNNEEIAHLFDLLRNLRQKEGTSFIFISHKMPEIFALADRYTVLRNGAFVKEGQIADTTPAEVTSAMVGRSLAEGEAYSPRTLGEPVLELDHLSGPGFHDISLTVRKGEILGLTGLQGSGSTELLQCLFGDRSFTAGKVRVKGKALHPGQIHAAMKTGLGMLPADRKENSVVPDLNLLENMVLAGYNLSAWPVRVHAKEERASYQQYQKELNIRAASPAMPITGLSGGNQQKVFLARWLDTGADILLLDNPTQGVDVGAKEEIYHLILQLAAQGKTVLVNTLEIPELRQVADRCAVFYEGGLAAVLPHEEIEANRIMLYSTHAMEE